MQTSNKVPRVIIIFLVLAFLSSTLNAVRYASETFVKAGLLSKMTYHGRTAYVDGIYDRVHGGTGYEFSEWAGMIIPKGYSYTLHRSPTDQPEEHEKYNFWNYYSWLNYNLYPRVTEDYAKPDFPPPYGDIVFSVSLKPSLISRSADGIMSASVHNRTYYMVARFDGDIYLLITGPFIKRAIIKEPKRWAALFSEFSRLYPGKRFMNVFKER